ncbi:MAG: SUMF1/EgtB/PvdO family nonheme iron enzyme, partial [Clostridia bacterium]|nr:SUMF1/EgtB/PvdO family nonheme iron enzyme [Clostridia bacterium]
TSNTNKETEWTGYSNGKAVVQKDKQVWNYITRDKAKKVAEGMYANNNAVISRLCSSYAWDTALKFIETKNAGYATNSEGDNYSGSLNHTGVGSTARNNIYDMGGNVCEWTTEVYSYQDFPCIGRGGFYGLTASDNPAGFRYLSSQTVANDYFGFRSTLFVGL